MAEALVRLHAAPVVDLGFLPDQRASVARALRPELAPSDDALQVAVWQAAQRLWPEVRARQDRRALVHGDYWPGNMLWNRRRLVGIVDWEEPRLGEPTQDVATCRGDLSILFGLEATDRFLDAYLGAGGSVRQLKFWDLLIATWAVRDIEDWATVYPVLGRPELTLAIARARIRAFAQAALQT
jgi:aminoglycoside phosphotransferase (APT) family kinase protein